MVLKLILCITIKYLLKTGYNIFHESQKQNVLLGNSTVIERERGDTCLIQCGAGLGKTVSLARGEPPVRRKAQTSVLTAPSPALIPTQRMKEKIMTCS